MKLNPENIEEQILLLVDGELDGTAAAEVIAYVELHKEYKTLLDLYRATQLQPDEAIAFPEKESLLKAEKNVAFIKTLPYANLRWAAAAAIVIIITTTAVIWKHQSETTEQPAIAVRPPVIQQRNTMPLPDVPRDSSIAKALPEVPRNGKQSSRQRVIAKAQPAIATAPVTRKKEEVTPLATAGKIGMPITANPVPAIALEEVITAMQPKSVPSAWSPLKEETLEGMDELAAELQALKTDVKEKAQLLRKATFVLRLGDKEIALNK